MRIRLFAAASAFQGAPHPRQTPTISSLLKTFDGTMIIHSSAFRLIEWSGELQSSERRRTKMKVRTKVKAGKLIANHNQTARQTAGES
jgi:hypothetical protein